VSVPISGCRSRPRQSDRLLDRSGGPKVRSPGTSIVSVPLFARPTGKTPCLSPYPSPRVDALLPMRWKNQARQARGCHRPCGLPRFFRESEAKLFLGETGDISTLSPGVVAIFGHILCGLPGDLRSRLSPTDCAAGRNEGRWREQIAPVYPEPTPQNNATTSRDKLHEIVVNGHRPAKICTAK